jgi:hypothetical protein
MQKRKRLLVFPGSALRIVSMFLIALRIAAAAVEAAPPSARFRTDALSPKSMFTADSADSDPVLLAYQAVGDRIPAEIAIPSSLRASGRTPSRFWQRTALAASLFLALSFAVKVVPVPANAQSESPAPEAAMELAYTPDQIEQRREIENAFSRAARKVYEDAKRWDLDERNKRSLKPADLTPAYHSWVSETARKTAADYTRDIARPAMNYVLSQIFSEPIPATDGRTTTFFDEVERIAPEYDIDPFLIVMHAALELTDLKPYEDFVDGIAPDASAGNIQQKPSTIRRALKWVYSLPPESRAAFPITRLHPSLENFENAVDIESVLTSRLLVSDRDRDKSWNPLEIHLACAVLRWQLDRLATIDFGGNRYFEPGFLAAPLEGGDSLDPRKNTFRKNLLNLFALAYTSDFEQRFPGKDMNRIFRNHRRNNLGLYSWMRMSWRTFVYAKKIHERYGNRGFSRLHFETFSSIDETGLSSTFERYGIWNTVKAYLADSRVFLAVMIFALGAGLAVYFTVRAAKTRMGNATRSLLSFWIKPRNPVIRREQPPAPGRSVNRLIDKQERRGAVSRSASALARFAAALAKRLRQGFTPAPAGPKTLVYMHLSDREPRVSRVDAVSAADFPAFLENLARETLIDNWIDPEDRENADKVFERLQFKTSEIRALYGRAFGAEFDVFLNRVSTSGGHLVSIRQLLIFFDRTESGAPGHNRAASRTTRKAA